MQSVIESRKAFYRLAALTGEQRNELLSKMLEALAQHRETILTANKLDITDAETAVATGDISKSLFKRLDLSEAKFDGLLSGVSAVRELPDPLDISNYSQQMTEGLSLYRVTCPIGVIAVIFEARPEAAVQITSLCIKSGNAVLLKGGKEARRSNAALVEAMRSALPDDLKEAVQLIESREAVSDLLKQDKYIDVIIPRGSSELVRYIKSNTLIPVLGHADGICHTYVHTSADIAKAVKLVIDAKTQYPAVCNATETLLIDEAVASELLSSLVPLLIAKQVTLKLCLQSILLCEPGPFIQASIAEDYDTEWCDLTLSVKVVTDVTEAVDHINTHGSHHTDCIVAEDRLAADVFMRRVDSAGVYCNASTRFADGFRYGFGAEVGVSTGKLHSRGPMGLEGLTTVKYKLYGDGHTVGEHGSKLERCHKAISSCKIFIKMSKCLK